MEIDLFSYYTPMVLICLAVIIGWLWFLVLIPLLEFARSYIEDDEFNLMYPEWVPGYNRFRPQQTAFHLWVNGWLVIFLSMVWPVLALFLCGWAVLSVLRWIRRIQKATSELSKIAHEHSSGGVVLKNTIEEPRYK